MPGRPLSRNAHSSFDLVAGVAGTTLSSRPDLLARAARLPVTVPGSRVSAKGAAASLLASADGYTPRATKLIEGAREKIGTLSEVAYALAENLPPPKAHTGRRRRRRRKRKGGQQQGAEAKAQQPPQDGETPKRRRRRRKPAQAAESAKAAEA